MPALRAQAAKSLRGSIRVPGDKSVSHRSLMLGALAVGETRITGLLEGADVLATAAAMRALGAEVTRHDDGTWTVAGRGIGALQAPTAVIDMGNAGTGVRLLMGLVATHPITCVFTGDASLSRRPMERVMGPRRRAFADHRRRRRRPGAGRRRDDGGVGAGQVRRVAGRAQHARRNLGDRACGDPRPH